MSTPDNTAALLQVRYDLLAARMEILERRIKDVEQKVNPSVQTFGVSGFGGGGFSSRDPFAFKPVPAMQSSLPPSFSFGSTPATTSPNLFPNAFRFDPPSPPTPSLSSP